MAYRRRSLSGESTSKKSEYTIKDINILMDLLDNVWQKWKHIGDQFQISIGTLEQIEEDNYSSKDRMRAVIVARLKQGGPMSSFELGYILRRPSIGETTLANKFSLQSRKTHQITKINVLHCIKPNIFETVFPYTYMKEAPSIVYSIFFVYMMMQFLSVFGDGALQPRKYTNEQYLNRVVFFLLHAILMIVFPSACYAQLCWLCALEIKYLKSEKRLEFTKGTTLEMENILTKRKISFSPLDFIKQISFLRKPKLQEVDFKCFQVPMHAVIYPCLLYWLGVFSNVPPSDVPPSTSWIRMDLWDCFAVGIALALTGIVKDIYCIENHVATILVDSDYDQNNRSKDIFRAIRQRWRAWDTFIHILVVVFLALISINYYFGEPFTKSQETPADDLGHKWNFLTFLLIIMQASGSSANATTKKICMIGYILLPLLMCVSAYTQGIVFDQIRNGFYFYKATGNIYLILSTTQLVTVLNWLLCLQRCYWRQLDKQYLSWKYHGLCLAALGIVILCLLVVPVKEFRHSYRPS